MAGQFVANLLITLIGNFTWQQYKHKQKRKQEN